MARQTLKSILYVDDDRNSCEIVQRTLSVMVGVDLLQRDVGFVWQRLGGRQMQPAKKGMQDPAVITHDKASSYPSAQFVGSLLSAIRHCNALREVGTQLVIKRDRRAPAEAPEASIVQK